MKKPSLKPLEQKWLISFLDMISLILAFFILLFSMSNHIDSHRIDEDYNSQQKIQESFAKVKNSSYQSSHSALNLNYLALLFKEWTKTDAFLQSFKIFISKESLILSLSEMDAFQDSLTLSFKGKETLYHLVPFLMNLNNSIVIENHIDPIPLLGSKSSSWEITLLRSLKIRDTLKKAGYTKQLKAIGKGDGNFKNALHQLTRRVDIIIYPVTS